MVFQPILGRIDIKLQFLQSILGAITHLKDQKYALSEIRYLLTHTYTGKHQNITISSIVQQFVIESRYDTYV